MELNTLRLHEAFNATNLQDLFLNVTHNEDRSRLRAAAQVTALDMAAQWYWKHAVLPEWAEVQSLCRSILSNTAAIAALATTTQSTLQRSHWIATLKFLEHTGEPHKFSPTLLDAGCWMVACDPSNKVTVECGIVWIRLGRLRNQALHTGRPWTLDDAAILNDLFKRFVANPQKWHPCFFGSAVELSRSPANDFKLAA